MDIKVNQIQQSMPVEQTQQVQETDGSFKFTLVSRIEEQDLQNALTQMMEEITRQERSLPSIAILKICGVTGHWSKTF